MVAQFKASNAGISENKIQGRGNIKLAQLPKVSVKLEKPQGIFITVASTHENEEKLVLEAFKKEQGKLIIVPRHPERFDKVDLEICEFIKNKNISYQRYSIKDDFDSDIILVDKMGILNDIYAISDVVILGGIKINYPLVFHGPFVMDSVEKIKSAYENYKNGSMGKLI